MTIKTAEQSKPEVAPEHTFLVFRDLAQYTGNKSISTIYRWANLGIFPKQVVTGPGSVAWRQSDVIAWAENPEAWGKANKKGQQDWVDDLDQPK